jgi:hypothetical protein
MSGKQATALAGFVVLGLSPSYVDWMQEPEKRWQMVGFYAVAVTLIYIGVFTA